MRALMLMLIAISAICCCPFFLWADYSGIYEGEHGKAVINPNEEGTYFIKIELSAKAGEAVRFCEYIGYAPTLERQTVFTPVEEDGDKLMVDFGDGDFNIMTPVKECGNIGVTDRYKKTANIWNTIFQGKGEGVFCGEESGDFVHICIMQNKEERWVMKRNFTNPEEKGYLYAMPKGTPVSFEFDVMTEHIPDTECSVPQLLLTGIRPK